MYDQYNREIDYMRISVTDRCNLRCSYCMPEGVPLSTMDDLLTFEEIAEIVSAAAQLGIRHIKLTGGEPLVRRGLASLIRMLKEIDGIEKVTLTTNGTMLEKHLDSLLEAGLDAVNISLDTLDPETYRRITGTDGLGTVLSAIDAACRAGIRTKINAVSLDLREEEWKALAELAKDRPLDVRFIELMPIGYGKINAGVSNRERLERLRADHPEMEEDPSFHGFGPAVYYRIHGWQGSIGMISAIHGKFCSTCNRVRLTSEGFLKACLCYHTGADLRQILREETPPRASGHNGHSGIDPSRSSGTSGSDSASRSSGTSGSDSAFRASGSPGMPEEKRKKLLEAMRRAIFEKPGEHCFERPQEITEEAAMISIGG